MIVDNNSNLIACDIHNSRFMEVQSNHYIITSIIKLRLLNNNNIYRTIKKPQHRPHRAILFNVPK